MFRPNLQPLASFETGWPVSKLSGLFQSWLLVLYDECTVRTFSQTVHRIELRNNSKQSIFCN